MNTRSTSNTKHSSPSQNTKRSNQAQLKEVKKTDDAKIKPNEISKKS